MAKETTATTSIAVAMRASCKENMSNAILSMTYLELMEVGNAMAELAQRRQRLESKEEFAALLHYWASNVQ